MSKTEYKVCHSRSIAEVERQVNEVIKVGYIPIGSIAFDGKEFYQATMISPIPILQLKGTKNEQ